MGNELVYNENGFIEAISTSFKQYQTYGARSSKKLEPIHNFIAQALKHMWGQEYYVHCMGAYTKELTVDGKYYPKTIDITVSKKDVPVFCLGVKFVTSNYKQNANNYFENMMGETANIQATKDLPYAQLIILRHKTPYYTKSGKENKIEIINEYDLQKYINLTYDSPQAHRPFAIGILFVDIDERNQKVKAIESKQIFNKDCADLLNSKLSIPNLFSEIANYKKYWELKRNGNAN